MGAACLLLALALQTAWHAPHHARALRCTRCLAALQVAVEVNVLGSKRVYIANYGEKGSAYE